jgi:predicted NBD/HSP70 family sugar kinase
LAEHREGFGKGYDNVVSIICDRGIGAGIVEDGKILRGSNNITGEIGHMKVMIDGRTCQCGQKGCVEAYASTYAVEKILSQNRKKETTFEQACILEKDGDELACNVLAFAKNALAVTVSNLLGIVNSKVVILSGEFFEHNKIYFDDIVNRVKETYYGKEYTEVNYFYSDKGNKINVLGASLLVFEKVFYR